MTWLYAAGAIAALLVARRAIHEVARRLHLRIGRLSNVLPGWNAGRCLRCETSFAYVRPHDTPYAIGHGRAVFPLCDPCWSDLGTPAARIPYYEILFAQWAASGARRQEDVTAIRAAVAAGL